jgi:hypothetical protein
MMAARKKVAITVAIAAPALPISGIRIILAVIFNNACIRDVIWIALYLFSALNTGT